MSKLKLFSRSTLGYAAVITAAVVMTVIFLLLKTETDILQDKLAKAQAKCTEAEREVSDLTEKYNQLQKQYLELEKTKAEEKNSPVVYLTFDDGPSDNTEKILDILDEYNVKATFFVIGDESGKAAQIYRRIVSEGHTAGNHTFSHEYHDVYASDRAFWDEYNKLDSLFFDRTGKHLEIMRFPGGSNNTVSERYCKGIMKVLTKQAHEKGLTYFDWNVSSLDAEKAVQSKNVIIDAVINGCADKKSCIVLMHDNKSKKTTVEALPVIIKSLKEQGYVFKTLSQQSETIQFLK